MNKLRIFFLIAILSILPTLLIWLPFFLRLEQFWTIPLPQEGMATIVSNYDGPLYIVVAKSLYEADIITSAFSFDLPTEYYAAHFPLYPLLIRALAPLVGYPYSSLIITALSSIFTLYMFYLLSREFLSQANALYLTSLFALFPARWLIVRSVGSPEPLFIGSIIAATYFFKKQKYWHAAIFGILAQLTKSPGILLFISLLGATLVPEFSKLAHVGSRAWLKKLNFKPYPILLIPLSLLGLFLYYSQAYNDFFAYFNSGDNIHLFFPPFQIFNYSAPWVNTHWLEEVIIIYLLGSYGLIKLIKQKRNVITWFVGVFFASILFVSHRDIMRYSLPIVPFLLIAYSDVLTSKEFKFVFALLIIPIYLFSLAFISNNIMPISDWAPLL